MANLFWGVSDALDLYSEYINAKKQRGLERSEKLSKKIDLVESKETNNQAIVCHNIDGSKSFLEKSKDLKVENNPLTINAETPENGQNDGSAVCGIQCSAEYSNDDKSFIDKQQILNDDVECQNISNDSVVSDKLNTVPKEDLRDGEKFANIYSESKSSNNTGIGDSQAGNIKIKRVLKEIEQGNEDNKFIDADSEDVHITFPKYTSYFTDIIKNTSQTDEKPNETYSNVDISVISDLNKDNNSGNFESEEPHCIKTKGIIEPLSDEINRPIKDIEIDNAWKKNSEEFNSKVKEYIKHVRDEKFEGSFNDEKCIKNSGAGDGPDHNDTIAVNQPTGDNVSDTTTSNNTIAKIERQRGGEDLNNFTKEEKGTLRDPIHLGNGKDPCLSNHEEFQENKSRVLNILIFGGGDPRHIIKTMAKRYTHCQNEGTASEVPVLNFYMVDGCMEVVARNIVLLGIALESPELISLRNKVHLFMDVYGNTLLRPICHQYLVSKATILLKMVSDKQTLEKIAPCIHIDNLKYREIDALQDAFEFWHPKPGYDFNIKDYWMSRLRRLLAVRYDARDGVFDWDLNMSLKDRGGQQICSQEYRYWRETGIAFTFPEYEQSKPNKTLAAGLVRNGDRYLHRGYIGDIQTGPFCTFGLRSLEERMHRSAHGENDYRATDVTERNLLEYFHEIQSGTPYVHNDGLSHKYGGVRFQMGERLVHNECDIKDVYSYDQPWINVEGIEVHFLPLHDVKEIGKGVPKWENFFDIAFVGYKYFEFLTDLFPKVLCENSLLIMETKLRSVEVKSRIAEFETELQGFARDAKLLSVLNYNALNSKNSILKFWKPDKFVQESLKKTD